MLLPPAPVVASVALGIAAATWDLAARRVPNVLTLGAAGGGLLFSLAVGGLPALGWSAAGWLAGCALFLPLFLVRGLGAGDVKLLAAFGAWLGPVTVAWIAVYGAIAGGCLAVVVALARGYFTEMILNVRTILAYWKSAGPRPVPRLTLADSKGPRLPYAVPIVAGTLVALWLR
jgi:prepilin peptidase CpaA